MPRIQLAEDHAARAAPQPSADSPEKPGLVSHELEALICKALGLRGEDGADSRAGSTEPREDGAPSPPPPSFFTTEGHPIHLSNGADEVEHHGMSAAGHREAAELLRHLVKTLLHISEAKGAAGDPKGALLFRQEAQQFLALMEGHGAMAGHKDAMARHGENAEFHGRASTDLARQISADLHGAPKDQLGFQDHERARAHPRFGEYVAHRQAQLAASEGVRHAALAAMGREGGAALPLELNRFLLLHGHGTHGLAEDPEAGPLAHDPEKARVRKSIRANRALQDAQKRGGEERGRQKKRADARAIAVAHPNQTARPEQISPTVKGIDPRFQDHLARADRHYLAGDLDAMDEAVTEALEADLGGDSSRDEPAAPAGSAASVDSMRPPDHPPPAEDARARLDRSLRALRDRGSG